MRVEVNTVAQSCTLLYRRFVTCWTHPHTLCPVDYKAPIWHITHLFHCAAIALVLLLVSSCGKSTEGPAALGTDPNVTTKGSIEVTAQLVEVPEGAIFKRELYDYATILKYKVLKVHRGQVKGDTIYVGHYDPFKPRAESADRRVKEIGGNLKQFEGGQVHRMALEVPIEDHFMGGIVNKYFGQDTGPIYWALWTNLAAE